MFAKGLALFQHELRRTFCSYRRRKATVNQSESHKEWGVYQQKQYATLFASKTQKLDKEVSSFIAIMNQKQIEAQLFRKIQNYLKHQEYANFMQTTSYSKICLLVAMSMRGVSSLTMNALSKQLIEHISRHDITNLIIEDEISLEVIFKELQRYMKLQPEKAKSQSLKNFMLIVIKNNFERLSMKLYPLLVNIISTNVVSHAMDYYKFLSIVDLLQERLTSICYLLVTSGRQKQEYMWLLHPPFLANLSSLYKLYKFKSQREAQVYYEFICEKILVINKMNSSNILFLINTIYRNFPYNVLNSKQQQYKSLLLQRILGFFNKHQLLKQEFIHSSYAHFFLYSIITHILSLQLKQTPTQIHNGIHYISADLSLKPPDLPDIFWQIYKKRPHLPDGYSVLRNAIASCYPGEYIDTKDTSKHKMAPLIESEMKIRISECLQEMGVRYVSQFEALGRYIDFKLQEGVLLQIDGLLHFSVRDFEHLDTTYFRNMHMLLSGYKLISISIYEYNMYRCKQQLKRLIQAKYDLIKINNAIFIL